MNSNTRKLICHTSFIAFCILNAASSTATADDWEIYTGSNTSSGTVKPNIVLLLDTSGSMICDDSKPVSDCRLIDYYRKSYDPEKAYPVTDMNGNLCPSDRLYYLESFDPESPPTRNALAEMIDCSGVDTTGSAHVQWMPIEALACQSAVNDLNTRGYYYAGYLTQYDWNDGPNWEDPTHSSSDQIAGSWIECSEDAGVHGKPKAPASITWKEVDQNGIETVIANPDDTSTAYESKDIRAVISVPDMDAADTVNGLSRSHLDKRDPVGDTTHPWVFESSGNAYTSTEWENDSLAEFEGALLHPNYLRYLFSVEDHDNNSATAKVRFTEITATKTRIEVLQDVMGELVNSWQNIRVAVMRYNGNDGASVLIPALDIDCADSDANCDPYPNNGKTNRERIHAAVTGFFNDANNDHFADDFGDFSYIGGGTPHTEAIWEAYNYLTSGPVDQGYDVGSHPYRKTTTEATWDGRGYEVSDGLDLNTYLSPIQYDCQANFIVHMTDGGTTHDGGDESGPALTMLTSGGTTQDVDEAIKDLPGFVTALTAGTGDASCEFTQYDSPSWDGVDQEWNGSTHASGYDSCADELTEYMRVKPRPVKIIDASGTFRELADPKPIKTYVIGFSTNNDFLESMASKGGGNYFTASDKEELKSSFDSAIESIKDVGIEVVSAPGVSVESFSRSVHLNDLYFNLYQHNGKPLYDGNLKKYKLAVDNNGAVYISDATLAQAVNPNGSFKDDAKSYWSSSVDGANVTAGGAASKLPTPRKVYTWLATSGTNSLTASGNAVHENNEANIPSGASGLDLPASESTDLPAADALELKQKYLKFARGLDAFNPDLTQAILTRKKLGDPLHTIPVVAIYDANSLDPTDPDALVFSMDNEGYLHAFDIDSGIEEWSFMPQQLLKNVRYSKINEATPTKLYGLDGFITLDEDLSNGDPHLLETTNADYAHLYFGMRRGGRNYYSLDVTSKTQPVRRWDIIGGSGDYDRLGETWSKVYTGDIKIGSNTTKQRVIIFTGGYDEATYDDKPNLMPTASKGNSIYMVDADTGKIIWTADNQNDGGPASATDYDYFSNMNYAFPADPAVVDMNDDGLIDRIYAVDIAGQLWRFDIHNGATGTGLVSGAMILQTGGTLAGETRHYFNQPDVVLVNDRARGRFVAVNFGSGNRDKPSNKDINDKFISFRDPNPAIGTTSTYTTGNTLTNLKDVTIWPTTAEDTFVNDIFTNYQGWYFDLSNDGEKNLASAITVNGETFFTTYAPPTTVSAVGCQIDLGTSRVYTVSVKSGKATQLYNSTSVIDGDGDRSKEVAYEGIPPSVVIIFPMATGGDPVGLIGPNIITPTVPNRLRRAYWYIKGRNPGK